MPNCSDTSTHISGITREEEAFDEIDHSITANWQGAIPKLLITLTYNGDTGRLHVEINKATNLQIGNTKKKIDMVQYHQIHVIIERKFLNNQFKGYFY